MNNLIQDTIIYLQSSYKDIFISYDSLKSVTLYRWHLDGCSNHFIGDIMVETDVNLYKDLVLIRLQKLYKLKLRIEKGYHTYPGISHNKLWRLEFYEEREPPEPPQFDQAA